MAKHKDTRPRPKVLYSAKNWSEYDKALAERGSVTIWLADDFEPNWRYGGEKRRGSQFVYSMLAITTMLTMKKVFHLPNRATEGFVRSIFAMLKVKLSVPDHSTLSRRGKGLPVALPKKVSGYIDLVVDSSGLKVYGEGEWKVRTHGKSKRRTWRKINIGADPASGEIQAVALTENSISDAKMVEPLLDQIDQPIDRFGGDGSYDKRKVYSSLHQRAPRADILIPPRKNAHIWQHGNSKAERLKRDENLRAICKMGASRLETDFWVSHALIGRNDRVSLQDHLCQLTLHVPKQDKGKAIACVWRFSMKRQFSILLPLFTLLLTACASLSPNSLAPTPLAAGLSDMVSGKVDVGGYALYYTCAGGGSPTVILEAGGPAVSTMWELVMVYYQGNTRICAYDRANLGNSDSAPKPRTFTDMTHDLHALLENVPIEGPYILAGHSMGGMLVRLYASQYPEDVVGLVLVDSAHPEMGTRLLAALPPEAVGEPQGLQAWREYGTWLATSDGRGPGDVEGVDMQVSNEQARVVVSLGDLPLIVISRSPNYPILAANMPSLPEEINTPLLQEWQELQAELEGLSTNSTRFVADHCGHNVILEEPRLVVEAIRQLVDDYRAESGEPILPVPDQTESASHAPVILSVTQRKEWQNGITIIYEDIIFTDSAGDAITVINKLISASEPSGVADDIIRASAEEQKQGALVISGFFRCAREAETVVEYRVFDAAGNMSAPETVTFSCPAPISPSLIVGIMVGMFMLGLAIWLLVRYRRSRRAAVTSV